MLVQVSARQLSFPPSCPCCLEPADSQIAVTATRTWGKRVVHKQTKAWSFPYCNRCLAHVSIWDSRYMGFALFHSIAIAVGLAACFSDASAGTSVFWVGNGLALIGGVIVQQIRSTRALQACSQSCQNPGLAVDYLGWNGSVHSFEVKSHDFAGAFMLANQKKLVNIHPQAALALDSARQYIDSPRHNNAVVSAPALPALGQTSTATDESMGDRSNEAVLRWLERIEAARGPVSRRTAVQAALQDIGEPKARERLLIGATKIEVNAVLDKVEGLKTVKAKKRHIEAAIAALQNDELPDELQEAELDILRKTLAELE